MKPTFEKTVDVLVKAYLKNQLTHADCAACVVGNLCGGNVIWKFLFTTDSDSGIQEPWLNTTDRIIRNMILRHYGVNSLEELIERAKVLCLSTGYSIDELKRIEYTFEMAEKPKDYDKWNEKHRDIYMFNGLMAVVSVLADIHNVDLQTKESAQKLFVK